MFIDFLKEFFTNYNLVQLGVDILLIASLSIFLIFVLTYAAKHNAGWFSGLNIIALLIIIVLVIFGGITQAVTLLVFLGIILLLTTVMFSNEIRRDLFKMSVRDSKVIKDEEIITQDEILTIVSMIVKSCQNLSKKDTGALIIIAPDGMQDSILDTGTRLNANISGELIETVFYLKSPLHDGAMIISGKKITSAGCYLPLTQRVNLPKELGTRHRAALGLSEINPTVTAICVSEETGIISIMRDGMYKRYLDVAELKAALEETYAGKKVLTGLKREE